MRPLSHDDYCRTATGLEHQDLDWNTRISSRKVRSGLKHQDLLFSIRLLFSMLRGKFITVAYFLSSAFVNHYKHCYLFAIESIVVASSLHCQNRDCVLMFDKKVSCDTFCKQVRRVVGRSNPLDINGTVANQVFAHEVTNRDMSVAVNLHL